MSWSLRFRQLISRHNNEGFIYSLFCFYLALMFAALAFVADTEGLKWVCKLSFIFTIGSYLLFYVGVPNKICSHLLAATIYFFITVVALEHGGIYASVITWACFAPTITMMQGRKTVFWWIFVSIVLISVIAAVTVNYPMHVGALESAKDAWWSFSLQLCGFLGSFLFIWLYETLQANQKMLLQKQAQELKDAQLALQHAQSHKDKFIASVSHELRTPMSAILGFSDLLIAQVKQPATIEAIRHIQTSAKQLLRVVNSILDYCQLLAGKLKLQSRTVSIRELLRKVAQTAELAAQEKNLFLKLEIADDVPVDAWLDPERLATALDHLLNNALKFTAQGGVTLRVSVIRLSIKIEVEDTGIGIGEDQQNLIFKRFYQASEEITRRYGGTGLGLAICDQIIQLHGGEMGVNSRLGIGSCFWLVLPINIMEVNGGIQQEQRERHVTGHNSSFTVENANKRGLTTYFNRKWNFIAETISKGLPELGGTTKVKVFLIFVLAIVVVVPFLSLVFPYTPIQLMEVLLSPVLLLILYASFKGLLSIKALVNIIVYYCMFHVFVVVVYTGGIHSSKMGWFVFIPIAHLYLLGSRHAVAMVVQSIAVFALIALITANNWLPTDPNINIYFWAWPLINYASMIFLMPYLPLYYQIMHASTRKKMADQNEQLSHARNDLLIEKKRMDEFIALASHEFRTPMNSIMGFNELLQKYLSDFPDALKIHTYMRQSAKHLMTIIDDILDYSEIENGHLSVRLESFDLHETCESAYRMFKSRINLEAISYRIDLSCAPRWVEGDSHRLMQLLVNLLGNAVKFTSKGSIELKVAGGSDGVFFYVKDTGIGIDLPRLDALFQHFEQVHALQPGRYQGHGLGLAISKRLIEILGGDISVSSMPQVGTAFKMWLPFKPSHSLAAIEKNEKLIDVFNHKLSFLIVDDQAVNRFLVKQILLNTWPMATLIEAEDGEQAMQRMLEQAFDVVLMDMIMPNVDGVEATKKIRNQFPFPTNKTPILGLTANVNPADSMRCIDAGMNDVLFKPFTQAALLKLIFDILKTKLG